ncbi:MAG: hypoxanthine phosphoribosyltransferase [Bacteroidales bacterium]|nr:hypoxanthine phosphoribosyltransferase [Bacteroidales bacterium]MDY4175336.1 hypoxanthine phosphoribosyltransferase [Bacteroidales bacterium]
MARVTILDKTFETSYPESQIKDAVSKVAQAINNDLKGSDPLFLCVLNGAFMFAADLMKLVNIPSKISFVKFASYEGTQSTGVVKQLIGLNEDLTGRTVVIIEDIVDTGITIEGLVKQCKDKGAADVRVATMLFKPQNCKINFKPDYVAIEIPNDFIVGYGLDYDGYGRNIPEILTLVK